jgi:hypothetical protein
MKSKINPRDADTRGEMAALRRAARVARKLARDKNTPFYVMKAGRIVNLNPRRKTNGRGARTK